MSQEKFVRPLPIYKQTLGRLQWDGKYWGENGALEYARRNSDLIKITPVGLISLQYSAATNAWAQWRSRPLAFWWLWRFVTCFCPTFFAARKQVETMSALTADECSVVGGVLARGGLKPLAITVFEHGISQKDVPFETEALLYADLYELRAISPENMWLYVWELKHVPQSFEQAKKPCGKISPEQLVRVLRKIGRPDWAVKLAAEQEVWDQVLKSRA